jgi:ArsR family metal-binding transcriptional regulator
MLIEHYDLEVYTPACNSGTERRAARASVKEDISAVLPYLNAVLPGAIYVASAPSLAWRKGEYTIVFYPHEVAISNVEDWEGAERELDALLELANSTWQRRAEITPNSETRQRPTPLAIFKLLPQTNCKQCGEPTCFSFALKLVAFQKTLSECRPLEEAHFAEQAALESLLRDVPPRV